MEKSEILERVDIMTAEELFDEIKEGNVTLIELGETNKLKLTIRNQIRALQQQLDVKDDEVWEVAQDGNERVLEDYIIKHPAGKHVSEAKQKIDLLRQKTVNITAQKQKILNNLKQNPNTYPPFQVIEFLQNVISESDLLNCNIPESAIESLHNIVRPNLILGTRPTSIPPGFTEVYFWGATGSGKTCALGAVLQMAQQKGYLNIAPGPGFRYATQLQNVFSNDGIANNFLPRPTAIEDTQYLPFTLKRPNERNSRSVSLIELSGEIFKCFSEINAGEPLRSQGHIDTFTTLNSFLKDNNRKIHFFFVDYNLNNKPDTEGFTQSDYLSAAATYFNNNKIFEKTTDAIYIVLTKSDMLKDEHGNDIPNDRRTEYAKRYLNENRYISFINSLKAICKKESINSGVLTVEPFSLGKVYFQHICNFEGDSAASIVEILMDRIPASQTSIFDVFNK
jgi:hypothetical protein